MTPNTLVSDLQCGRGLNYGSVCSGIEAPRACRACGEVKDAAAFHRQGKRGRHTYCAHCYNSRYRGVARKPISREQRRAQNIRSRYGLSPEDVSAMLEAQGGVCAICLNVPARPCVDHDHQSGKPRGILCHGCNIKLPAVEDEAYRSAAEAYLARSA